MSDSTEDRVVLPFARPISLPQVRTAQSDQSMNGTLFWQSDAHSNFDKDLDSAGRRKCYTTGVGALDETVCGIMQGNVLLVAGRTGSGKSSLAMTAALSLAVVADSLPVLYVSLEMPERDMAIRSLAWLTSISQTRLLAADIGRVRLDDFEREAIATASRQIGKRMRTMAGSFSIADVAAEARRMKADGGLSVIVLDHVGLVSSQAKRGETREREVAAASRGFKQLAMELDVGGLMLAQMNRGADKEKEPELHHLRESGGLEQDAAAVAFMWPTDDDAPGKTTMFVRKNRFGSKAKFEVAWDGPSGRVGEAASLLAEDSR